MRKIALISSYCDTQEKKEVLKKNLDKMKKLGIDTFVISPIKMSIDSDFFFITRENPILGPDTKAISFWRSTDYEGKKLKLIEHVSDYGWASLYQIKKIMSIAKNLDYDLFYFLIYDLIIDEKIEKFIQSDESNLLFQRRDSLNKNVIYPYSLHFSVFDKQIMEAFSQKISFDEYVNNNGFAEDFIRKWSEELNLPNSELVVEDSVVNYSNPHKFDYSETDEYKLFISKNSQMEVWTGNPPITEILSGNLKLYFYEIFENLEIKVEINGDNYFFKIQSDRLIEFEIPSENIDVLRIHSKKGTIDYSHKIKKISRNLIHVE